MLWVSNLTGLIEEIYKCNLNSRLPCIESLYPMSVGLPRSVPQLFSFELPIQSTPLTAGLIISL
jgi:hypothetical protein